MELTTENGQFELPADFSITIERTNPLMSDEGDTTVPMTLPPTPNNLKVAGHKHRIDYGHPYLDKTEAILRVGPIQKKGRLVMDSVSRHDGIEAVFAFDNSDLYVAAKDKSLKEIFAPVSQTFSSIAAAAIDLLHIYKGDTPGDEDYTVFPVAVSAYESGGETVYQYNNEISLDKQDPQSPVVTQLVYNARMVHEGDRDVAVPEGYGLAPFLKLYRMIDLLFDCLGYTVTENVFSASPYSAIVLVHNCSDALVTSTLRYADLVPSCTLSEFLTWLEAKFHVQASVNSETKTVRVLDMEDRLAAAADMDLSGMVMGDATVVLQPSKRVVLTPTTTIEGTEPAAETFDKLLDKHQQFAIVSEPWYLAALETSMPGYTNALVMRKATGQFYTMKEGMINAVLGTNHFKYDRNNSEETEEYSQVDVIPLMIVRPYYYTQGGDWGLYSYATAPYIGERIHLHTKLNDNEDQEEEQKQEIIVVQAAHSSLFAYVTTGTTQGYVPYHDPKSVGSTEMGLSMTMTAHGLYKRFWKQYNQLLLNSAPHIKCNLLYPLTQVLESDMATPKLLDNQKLLPVSTSTQVSAKLKATEAEFLLVQTFIDEIKDTEILPSVSV